MKHLFDTFHEPPSEINSKNVSGYVEVQKDLDMSRGTAIIPYGSEDDEENEEDQSKSPDDHPFALQSQRIKYSGEIRFS